MFIYWFIEKMVMINLLCLTQIIHIFEKINCFPDQKNLIEKIVLFTSLQISLICGLMGDG